MKDTAQCLEYARRGLLRQICEVRPLSQIGESVKQLKRGEVAGRIVIDFNMEGWDMMRKRSNMITMRV